MREKLLSNEQTGFEDIKKNYARICENIERAMSRAGRSDKVRLMEIGRAHV